MISAIIEIRSCYVNQNPSGLEKDQTRGAVASRQAGVGGPSGEPAVSTFREGKRGRELKTDMTPVRTGEDAAGEEQEDD